VPCSPSSTCVRSVHSCTSGLLALRPRGDHPRSPVPSSWFLTTSMVSSASSVAGLLHPAADPGVRRVSVPVPWFLARWIRHVPATLGSPFEEIPVDSACRVTAVACLPAVLRDPWASRDRFRFRRSFRVRLRARSAGFEALLHRSGLVSSAAVADVERPAPSWASFLFKVLRATGASCAPIVHPSPRREPVVRVSSVSHLDLSRSRAGESGHMALVAPWGDRSPVGRSLGFLAHDPKTAAWKLASGGSDRSRFPESHPRRTSLRRFESTESVRSRSW